MAQRKKPTAPKPPAYLSRAAKAWWKTIVTDFALESHHLKILEAACGAWDRAEQARALLAKEGLTITDRFKQPKVHPAALIERDNKTLFARLVRELGLDVEGSPADNRPPRTGGQRY